MKRILGRLMVAVAALLAVSACSKEMLVPRAEYDAEWAAAYFLGTDEPGSVGYYRLSLAQGRTDEDLALVSSGAVLNLQLNAPAAEGLGLPDGTYRGSTGSETAFTYNYGEMQPDSSIAGSYVGIRPDVSKPMQYYPVGDGEASIVFGKDGGYEIHVRVRSESRTFVFKYGGPVETYDCTEPGL